MEAITSGEALLYIRGLFVNYVKREYNNAVDNGPRYYINLLNVSEFNPVTRLKLSDEANEWMQSHEIKTFTPLMVGARVVSVEGNTYYVASSIRVVNTVDSAAKGVSVAAVSSGA